mmetsp:Transcript_16601/g.34647  ORF Transcript_16601/g.34647 Transcript_16601/m.34647 type:complete len:342 (+) Transcript_16601:184-1209(+)
MHVHVGAHELGELLRALLQGGGGQRPRALDEQRRLVDLEAERGHERKHEVVARCERANRRVAIVRGLLLVHDGHRRVVGKWEVAARLYAEGGPQHEAQRLRFGLFLREAEVAEREHLSKVDARVHEATAAIAVAPSKALRRALDREGPESLGRTTHTPLAEHVAVQLGEVLHRRKAALHMKTVEVGRGDPRAEAHVDQLFDGHVRVRGPRRAVVARLVRDNTLGKVRPHTLRTPVVSYSGARAHPGTRVDHEPWAARALSGAIGSCTAAAAASINTTGGTEQAGELVCESFGHLVGLHGLLEPLAAQPLVAKILSTIAHHGHGADDGFATLEGLLLRFELG